MPNHIFLIRQLEDGQPTDRFFAGISNIPGRSSFSFQSRWIPIQDEVVSGIVMFTSKVAKDTLAEILKRGESAELVEFVHVPMIGKSKSN